MDHLSFLPSTPSPDHLSAVPELSTIAHAGQPLTALLQQIAEVARRHVPATDEASVTMYEDGKPRTVACTGSLAAVLDERQYARGSGPCLEAAASGGTILVSDGEPTPYPDFVAACRRSGVRQVLSTGLPRTAGVTAGLNLYGQGQEPYDAATVRSAETFAAFAAVAVANAVSHHAATEKVQQLQAAMASRAVIEQAKGLIMARQHCTEDEAFQVLVRASQHQNRKLRDIATAVMATTQQ